MGEGPPTGPPPTGPPTVPQPAGPAATSQVAEMSRTMGGGPRTGHRAYREAETRR